MSKVHHYVSDDRDQPEPAELVVYALESGDFFIGSVPYGERALVNAVRIRASGFGERPNAKLVAAVKLVFEALGGWKAPGDGDPPEDVDELQARADAGDYSRASGDAACSECARPLRRHPRFLSCGEYLTVDCRQEIYKL